jgi:predicted TIM-barrel fold metal-dependent hydrolase
MLLTAIAEIVSAYPGRFRGIANWGLGSMEASLSELERCIDVLDFLASNFKNNIEYGKHLDCIL